MIRLIVALFFAALYLIVTAPVLLVLWLLQGKKKPNKHLLPLRMVQGIFKVFLFVAGVKKDIRGKENIPEGEAVCFVSNHRSYFDVILGYSLMKNLTGFVAKNDLEKIPMFSAWMKLLNCLFMDREDIRKGIETIKQGTEYLNEGVNIWICPEGTRNKGEEGSMLEFHEGSMKMAQKSGAYVVPVAITNSFGVWEKQFPRLKSRRVILEFGKPFKINELSKEDQKHSGAYAKARIAEMLAAHAGEKKA